MIVINNIQVAYNTFVHFRKHYISSLPNDDAVWASAYRVWLQDQGARTLKANLDIQRNALDFNPIYDQFIFENDSDATAFLLKWS